MSAIESAGSDMLYRNTAGSHLVSYHPCLGARRITELLDQVDAGSQVVATEPLDIVEDVATPRRDSEVGILGFWVEWMDSTNEVEPNKPDFASHGCFR